MLPGSTVQPSLLVSENSLHLGLSCLVMMPSVPVRVEGGIRLGPCMD